MTELPERIESLLEIRYNISGCCSLADLYDEAAMPSELCKVHQANDNSVMDAYGFAKCTEAHTSESACVAAQMEM